MRLYARAARFYPEDARLLTEWGKLAAELGDVEEARDIFQRTLGLQPAPPPYAFQSAAALEVREGEIDAARAIFSRGVATLVPALRSGDDALAEELVPLVHAWAVCEWRHGDALAARGLFRQAEELSPAPCSWVFMWRAKFEAAAENYPLARHYYARAVNADPNDATIWRLWSDLETAAGNEERASLYARRAAHVVAMLTLSKNNEKPQYRRIRLRARGPPPAPMTAELAPREDNVGDDPNSKAGRAREQGVAPDEGVQADVQQGESGRNGES